MAESSYFLANGFGVVRASKLDYFWMPHEVKSRYGAVLCHGAGVNDLFAGVTWPAAVILAAKLARNGIPCYSGALSDDAFGNDAVITDIEAARTALGTQIASYKPTNYKLYDTSKIHMLGISMGNFNACMYAARNVSKVASVQGMIPLCDLIDAYAKNLGSFTASEGVAWGLTQTTISITTTNGSASISGTGFTSGQENYVLVAASNIPAGTRFHFLTSTTGTLKDALGNAVNATGTGAVSTIVAQPLPVVGGSNNADLITQAAALLAAAIPGRLFNDNSGVDPVIVDSTVQALATAAGFQKISTGVSGLGHTNATIALINAYNSKTDGQDIADFMLGSSLSAIL